MVVKLYLSGISGNKEVKKKQQRVQMILDSKSVTYEAIDITEPGREKEKEYMQQKGKVRESLGKHPLPPQIFNEDDYCGDYEDFDLANETDELEAFLHIPIPSKLSDNANDAKVNGSRENNEGSLTSGAKTTEENGVEVELTSLSEETNATTEDTKGGETADEDVAAVPETANDVVNEPPANDEDENEITPAEPQDEPEAEENSEADKAEEETEEIIQTQEALSEAKEAPNREIAFTDSVAEEIDYSGGKNKCPTNLTDAKNNSDLTEQSNNQASLKIDHSINEGDTVDSAATTIKQGPNKPSEISVGVEEPRDNVTTLLPDASRNLNRTFSDSRGTAIEQTLSEDETSVSLQAKITAESSAEVVPLVSDRKEIVNAQAAAEIADKHFNPQHTAAKSKDASSVESKPGAALLSEESESTPAGGGIITAEDTSVAKERKEIVKAQTASEIAELCISPQPTAAKSKDASSAETKPGTALISEESELTPPGGDIKRAKDPSVFTETRNQAAKNTEASERTTVSSKTIELIDGHSIVKHVESDFSSLTRASSEVENTAEDSDSSFSEEMSRRTEFLYKVSKSPVSPFSQISPSRASDNAQSSREPVASLSSVPESSESDIPNEEKQSSSVKLTDAALVTLNVTEANVVVSKLEKISKEVSDLGIIAMKSVGDNSAIDKNELAKTCADAPIGFAGDDNSGAGKASKNVSEVASGAAHITDKGAAALGEIKTIPNTRGTGSCGEIGEPQKANDAIEGKRKESEAVSSTVTGATEKGTNDSKIFNSGNSVENDANTGETKISGNTVKKVISPDIVESSASELSGGRPVAGSPTENTEQDTSLDKHDGVSTEELLVDAKPSKFDVNKIAYSPQLQHVLEGAEPDEEKGIFVKSWNRRASEADLVKHVRTLLDVRDARVASRIGRDARSPDPHAEFLTKINCLISDVEIEEDEVSWPVVTPPKEPTPPPVEPPKPTHPQSAFILEVLRVLNSPPSKPDKSKKDKEKPLVQEFKFLKEVKSLLNAEEQSFEGRSVYFTKERAATHEDSAFVKKVRVLLDEKEKEILLTDEDKLNKPYEETYVEKDHSDFLGDVLVLLNDQPMDEAAMQYVGELHSADEEGDDEDEDGYYEENIVETIDEIITEKKELRTVNEQNTKQVAEDTVEITSNNNIKTVSIQAKSMSQKEEVLREGNVVSNDQVKTLETTKEPEAKKVPQPEVDIDLGSVQFINADGKKTSMPLMIYSANKDYKLLVKCPNVQPVLVDLETNIADIIAVDANKLETVVAKVVVTPSPK